MIRGWRIFPTTLAFLVAGSMTFFGGSSVQAAEQKNLVELHRNAGSLPDKDCLACHGDILKATTLDKKFKTYHRVHLESKLETPKKCSDCHLAIDLREGSAAAVRKQVDPKGCEDCHSGNVKGAKVLFAK